MQSSNGGKERTIQQTPAHRSRKAKLECVSQKVAPGKRPQEALRQSEARYRQLFEGVGDAVMVYGLNGRFLDCNKLTLERLGYNYDEFLNLSAGDIVHPDFHATMRDSQKKIWAGQATVVESAHRCKDGRVIPAEVNACRIEYDG
jgi:PAS domain S-box-containing protein